MVLYGYTVGDTDSDPNTAGTQFEVYRFRVDPFNPTPLFVGRIPALNSQNNDLEGLGTNPSTGRVSAVNEARASVSTTLPNPTIDPDVVVVNNIDVTFAPQIKSVSNGLITRSSLPANPPNNPPNPPINVFRFGFDSGADFGRDTSSTGTILSTNVLYNISGNDTTSNGVPVGSSLYKIPGVTTGTGVTTLIDRFGTATTTAQIQGSAPTNPGKFADGLAIDNLNPGRTRAFASDFDNLDDVAGDTTRNNLYKVDLFTGELSAPIVLRNPPNPSNPSAPPVPLNLNQDSGLAFTNAITSTSPTQRLLALLENGQVYEITGYQDEHDAPGLTLGTATGVNGAGFATARLLGTVNLPNASSGATDYEGFTIVNE
ncbi:hypothetical protein [Nostoc sp. WHI]|uniref:hypothetical protein n=1 Tax=Nostoc sp. WHI TaxID=2650611 RepID=UPI0018C516AF|nr:hypothetical protein [Nostoc sp. WHI]MBG1269888.1 hypothetical protein [Nostoc sp. WHI]